MTVTVGDAAGTVPLLGARQPEDQDLKRRPLGIRHMLYVCMCTGGIVGLAGCKSEC